MLILCYLLELTLYCVCLYCDFLSNVVSGIDPENDECCVCNHVTYVWFVV